MVGVIQKFGAVPAATGVASTPGQCRVVGWLEAPQMRSLLHRLIASVAIATLVYSGSSLAIPTPVSAVGASTTTAITSSLDPSFVGDAVTFTATVTSSGAPVTSGTVTFLEVPFVIGGPVPVDGSGQATFSTSTLDEGSHAITARYDGDATFATSNGTLFQHVDNHTIVSGDTYCNTGTITIPQYAPAYTIGNATPYASHIFVSGYTANVADVNLQLMGLIHTFPADIDLLLVGPTGANLIAMSDIGGGLPALNVDLILDDQAASFLPGPPLTSGTYKPLNSVGPDTFPLPAPAPSSATKLATFNGANPNGTWSLFVVDDAGGNSGALTDGWCLTIDETSVTVNQATGQSDPTNSGSVHFTAVFERPVTGFGDSAADVTLGGTAGPTTAVVAETAPNDGTTYDIAVSGMTGSGTVTASVPAGAALDTSLHGNANSTSTDNSVTFAPDTQPPTLTNVNVSLNEGGRVGSAPVKVSWYASDNKTPTSQLVYQVQRREFLSGAWTAWQMVTQTVGTNPIYELPLWHPNQQRVRARDQAGHWSAWSLSWPITFIRRDDDQFNTTGTWTHLAAANAMRNGVTRSHQPGATATLAFRGQQVALIMPTGAGKGTVEVCLDPGISTQQCRTIDLSAGPAQTQRLVAVLTTPWGDHTLRIKVISGVVDLDGAIFTK